MQGSVTRGCPAGHSRPLAEGDTGGMCVGLLGRAPQVGRQGSLVVVEGLADGGCDLNCKGNYRRNIKQFLKEQFI